MLCYEYVLQSVYGLTETTAVTFQSQSEDSEFLMTSTVGRVSEHVEVNCGHTVIHVSDTHKVIMCVYGRNYHALCMMYRCDQ